jgi:PPM family protein phosphatase
MIDAEDIIKAGIQLGEELEKLHKDEQYGFDSFVLSPDGFKLQPGGQSGGAEEDIRNLMRQLIEGHSTLVPHNLRSEELLSHLAFLAPNLPLDLRPILTDGLSGRIQDCSTLLKRLRRAEQLAELRSSQSVKAPNWQVGFDTHIGKAKAWRSQTNQDSFFFDVEGPLGILMVSDGISTSTAGSGDIASNITSRVTHHFWADQKEELKEAGDEEIQDFLIQILAHANFAICENAKEHAKEDISAEIPMGATVLLAIIKGDTMWLANLGDSRGYILTEDGAALITGDQNLRGEKLRLQIPMEPHDNYAALIRYLGHFDSDFKAALPVPDICQVKLLPNEAVLLCSDGLTDYAASSHYALGELLMKAHRDNDISSACSMLTQRANEAGGGDNITTVIAKPIF